MTYNHVASATGAGKATVLNNHTCNYLFVGCVLGGFYLPSNWWSDDLPVLWQRSQDLPDPRFCVLGTDGSILQSSHWSLQGGSNSLSPLYLLWLLYPWPPSWRYSVTVVNDEIKIAAVLRLYSLGCFYIVPPTVRKIHDTVTPLKAGVLKVEAAGKPACHVTFDSRFMMHTWNKSASGTLWLIIGGWIDVRDLEASDNFQD